jgi:hypothetical protein
LDGYWVETTATLASVAGSLLLSTTCFPDFFVAGAITLVDVGALDAAGAGAVASCVGGCAAADASLYSHAKPTAGARPKRTTAVAADTFLMATSLVMGPIENLRVPRTIVNGASGESVWRQIGTSNRAILS